MCLTVTIVNLQYKVLVGACRYIRNLFGACRYIRNLVGTCRYIRKLVGACRLGHVGIYVTSIKARLTKSYFLFRMLILDPLLGANASAVSRMRENPTVVC